MNRMISILIIVSIILVGFNSVAMAEPNAEEPLDVSHLEGRLAFPVFEDGTYNIYVSNIDGSDRQLLLTQASQPDFNSDGSQIAYRSWRSDDRGIFTTPVKNIVPWNIQGKSVAESARPVWSPDDQTIVFHSYEEMDRNPRIYYTGGDKEVYLSVRTDQTGRFVDIRGIDPDWMPDGSIVYTERECMECGIFNISLTGGLIARLTDQAQDEAPAVSPDGKRVAFMSTRDEVWDLYVVNADGSNLVRLTEDAHVDGLPIWAPDNQTLIFVSNRDGEWGIWAMDADSKVMAKLFNLGGDIDGTIHEGTSRGWTEERISWAPTAPPPPTPAAAAATDLDTSKLEGRLAFPVFEDGTYNIYVSNIDGSDRQLLLTQASQTSTPTALRSRIGVGDQTTEVSSPPR